MIDLQKEIAKAIDFQIRGIHTLLLGEISEFPNVSTASANVIPYGLRVLSGGNSVPYPKLLNVTIASPKGVNYIPSVGDKVLIFFTETNKTLFWSEEYPREIRHHNLNDAIAIPISF